MPVTETACPLATASLNSDRNMLWALSLLPPSGSRGLAPLPVPSRKPGRGAPPKRLQRNAEHQPISVKQLAFGLPPRPGKKSGGARGVKELYARGSPQSACAPHIATTSALSHIRKNGF